ncbi:MAG: OsmC family protein [Phycisphaeraceae bacterium]|nr:OsmC family protein [Phycisphaeraceae bacterium]MCB9848080.1 OsmC family protein [Phycisphaeraceae bacterium]
MSEHVATVEWVRPDGVGDEDFVRGRYSRAHEWRFDGGITVPGSPDPAVVRPPRGVEEAVDPEEALVASASSCHMLTFLWLASRAGYAVARYTDNAVGVMTKNDEGRPFVSGITLHVAAEYSGERRPSAAEEAALHHAAHEQCPIANSILAEVRVERVTA